MLTPHHKIEQTSPLCSTWGDLGGCERLPGKGGQFAGIFDKYVFACIDLYEMYKIHIDLYGFVCICIDLYPIRGLWAPRGHAPRGRSGSRAAGRALGRVDIHLASGSRARPYTLYRCGMHVCACIRILHIMSACDVLMCINTLLVVCDGLHVCLMTNPQFKRSSHKYP